MSATEIIIVSGLPRSGTSLMMQMLARGGIEILTDNLRVADTDNPRGYCEYERVKKTKDDPSWLPLARGKAVKLVSQLLYDLPGSENYRVLFMERDLDETLASQEKMLARLGQTAAPRDKMRAAFQMHLDRLHAWLADRPNFAVRRVAYQSLVTEPESQAAAIRSFLGDRGDVSGMIAAVDPALYRNRKSTS